MKRDVVDGYRRDVERLVASQNSEPVFLEIDGSEGVCPIINEPCKFVSSCDDVLTWRFGVVLGEAPSCSRAVFKVGKK